MRRAVVVAIALIVAAAGCSSGTDEVLEIGVKRSSVGLVFKEERGDGPKPKIEDAFAPQAAGPLAALSTAIGTRPVLPPVESPAPTCPEAGPGVFPEEPVSVAITKKPRAGSYPYRNTGSVHVEGAATPFRGRVPERSVRQIKVLPTVESGEISRFEIIQRGVQDAVTTTTYRVTESTFDLVSTHTKNARGESSFEPSPPVTLVMLGEGEGAYWNSAGADPSDLTAMVVEGRIEKRESVDVCGEVYDTYRVVSNETMVNLFTGYRYETTEPTVYNFATHLGGLFLREDVKSTTTVPTVRGDILVHLDYVSTAMSAEPVS